MILLTNGRLRHDTKDITYTRAPLVVAMMIDECIEAHKKKKRKKKKIKNIIIIIIIVKGLLAPRTKIGCVESRTRDRSSFTFLFNLSFIRHSVPDSVLLTNRDDWLVYSALLLLVCIARLRNPDRCHS